MSDTEQQNMKSTAPDFNAMEQETIAYWEENAIYEKSLEQTAGKQPYVFYDGPPFATGLPHYGHILASTIKDAIPRYQTMKGNYVRRRWGWDCHGLPIENIVEKQLGISGKKQIEELGVDKFNEACRQNVLQFADEWGKMVRRMGRWTEFENSYKTMDSTFQESVWWALKQLWDKQLVYEDRKVLLYCSRCETPLSNFEVAMDNSYKDVTENSVYVKFKLHAGQRIVDFITDDKTFVLAWTTTPWTLPGNTALNIGPGITYVVVQQGNEKYIVAKDRLEIMQGEYEVVREAVSARSLEQLKYEPLYKLAAEGGAWARAHQIYSEEFVTTTDGTGVVHNAAMYGEEDFQAAKQRELPRVDMLDHKGHYLDIAPEFLRGMFFKNAEKPVLQDLEQRGLVYRIEPFTHSYPHCWRCGTPLFYNALPAWFVNIQKIKPELLKANESINWYPEHLKDGRFGNSVAQAPDWNISRNRYWATALPFWKCENTDCRHVSCFGSVADLQAASTNFTDVYPNFTGSVDILDLHKPYIDSVLVRCEKCSGTMRRVSEVVDCWVESGSMPFAEIHYPFENNGTGTPEDFKNRFPADFVAEYIAQTRAWFYLMHVMGVSLFGRAPFKHVVTTGNILAADGSKMSKSKNNYPDPWILIDKYGMDAIRFYLLQAPVMNGDDFNFSEVGVKEINQKVNMLLYNVWSFYKMYQQESLQLTAYSLQPKHVLDKWVIERLQVLVGRVTDYLDKYNTVKACKEIVEFINDLSTWYVRRSRDRIKGGDDAAKEALDTLGYVLARTCQTLAPIAPFLSETIYRDVTGEASVHLSQWPTIAGTRDERALQQMDLVREVVSLALAARKTAGISVRQPLATFAYKTSSTVPLSDEHIAIILEELNVKAIADYDSLAERGTLKGGVQQVAGTGSVSGVLLDTVLTEELRLEGYARELERAVQDLRKKSSLQVGDMVELYYNTTDSELETVLLESLDRKKTFVALIAQSLEVEADNETQAEIDGKPIWLGLVKQ